MFLRAQLSAQMATIIDFAVTLLLVNGFEVYYLYATFVGSIYGGVVNCIINYKWTFKRSDVKMRHVVFKFILVWIGSIWLNTWGTFFFTELMGELPWVKDTLRLYFTDYFIFPKLVVAIIVALIWNYNMQRLFVYRNLNIFEFFKKKEKD